MLIAIVCVALPARADDVKAAREHYHRANTLYDLGQYIEAAHEYEKAFAAKDEAVLLFDMGQAYRLGGDNNSALRAYKSYLRREPHAKSRDVVEGYIVGLEKAVEAQQRAATQPPTTTMPLRTPEEKPAPPAQTEKPTTAEKEPTTAEKEPTTAEKPAAVLVAPAPPPAPRRRTWIAGVVVGVVVAVGVGLGVGLGIGLSHDTPPSPSLGAVTVR
jgi:tetratricopeptide (TPR) repeat protein